MRRRDAVVFLLGIALVGCAGGDAGKPPKAGDPPMQSVTIEVKGMT